MIRTLTSTGRMERTVPAGHVLPGSEIRFQYSFQLFSEVRKYCSPGSASEELSQDSKCLTWTGLSRSFTVRFGTIPLEAQLSDSREITCFVDWSRPK